MLDKTPEKATTKGVQFGKAPTELIASGAFAPLPPSAASVYLRLVAASKNWQCSIGQRRIASDMGLHIDTVREAIKAMREAGIIESDDPGNGRRMTYIILTNRTGNSEGSPPANRTGKSVHVQREQSIEQKAAAAIVGYLKSIGMTGNLLTNCSALEDLTVEQARAVYGEVKRRPDVRNVIGLVGRMLLDGERGGVRGDTADRLRMLLDAGLSEDDAKRYAEHKGLSTERLDECVQAGDAEQIRQAIRESPNTASREPSAVIGDTEMPIFSGYPSRRKPEVRSKPSDMEVGTW